MNRNLGDDYNYNGGGPKDVDDREPIDRFCEECGATAPIAGPCPACAFHDDDPACLLPGEAIPAHFFHALNCFKPTGESFLVREIGGRLGWIELAFVVAFNPLTCTVVFDDNSTIELLPGSYARLRGAWGVKKSPDDESDVEPPKGPQIAAEREESGESAARELAQLGKKMRAAQKAYFKGRSGESLSESKRLEKEFDRAVERILNPQGELSWL